MAINVSKKEAKELGDHIHNVLFPETGMDGRKTMCAVFPSNGLYVAEGLVRYVREHESETVDVTDFFNEMKVRDYYDLRATFALKTEMEKNRGGNY